MHSKPLFFVAVLLLSTLFIYTFFVEVYPATATLVSPRDSTRDIIAGTDEDIDGDGIANSQDLCPNGPPRSMNISDYDNDGIGDECDSIINNPPVDLSKSTDTDGDALNDNLDNCPKAANPEQKDTDVDGIGDVCDSIVNPPPITPPRNIPPNTGAGIVRSDRQVQGTDMQEVPCPNHQFLNEQTGLCVPEDCPESQVLDEVSGICVLKEPETAEEEPAQPEPEEGQPSEEEPAQPEPEEEQPSEESESGVGSNN